MTGMSVVAGAPVSAMLATEKDAPAPVALIAIELPIPATVPDDTMDALLMTGAVLSDVCKTCGAVYPTSRAAGTGGPLLMLVIERAAREPVAPATTDAPTPPMLPTLMPLSAVLVTVLLLLTDCVMPPLSVADQAVVLTKAYEMEATAPVAAIDTDAPFPVRSPTETAGFWLPPSRVLVTLPPAPTAPLLTIWLMFPNVGVLNESELIELTDTAAWAPTAETEAVAPAAKPPPSVKSPLLLTAAWFCVTDWTMLLPTVSVGLLVSLTLATAIVAPAPVAVMEAELPTPVRPPAETTAMFETEPLLVEL